jgi:hypothetical protein
MLDASTFGIPFVVVFGAGISNVELFRSDLVLGEGKNVEL